MKNEKWATAAAREKNDFDSAKVTKVKDIVKVLEFFRYTLGTTLDCAYATGVLRNSITWYVKDLINEGLLQVVSKRPDSHTGRKAGHYSADASLWKHQQLSLFREEDMV